MFLPIGTPQPDLNGMSGYLGMGCAGKTDCGCGCSKGMGIFDSTDIADWGILEWGSIAAGIYLAGSLLGDTKRTVKGARRRIRKMRAA